MSIDKAEMDSFTAESFIGMWVLKTLLLLCCLVLKFLL